MNVKFLVNINEIRSTFQMIVLHNVCDTRLLRGLISEKDEGSIVPKTLLSIKSLALKEIIRMVCPTSETIGQLFMY